MANTRAEQIHITMLNHGHPLILAIALLLASCQDTADTYLAAASISENGFARDSKALRQADGQAIRLWGYVDPGNLYGDAGAKKILGEWWSGAGPEAGTWRFNLKASKEDGTGHSFPVFVPNDMGRDALLKLFLADAKEGRPTQVFLKGRLFTFDAPGQWNRQTGLYLRLESSRNIRLAPEAEQFSRRR